MFDLVKILEVSGYLGLTGIIFAESGLFFGFFLPGDSLLFTAGFLASQGFFNILIIVFLSTLAAITGDSFGYWFGRKIGPKIFVKEDSFFFSQKRLDQTKHFFYSHGPKSIILARFIPAIRTLTPILAGVGEMEYKKFLKYNIAGGLLWATGMPLVGYFLGSLVPNIDKYIIPIILGIILTSFIPVFSGLFKAWRESKGK